MKPYLIIGGILSVVGILLLCSGILFFVGVSRTVINEGEAIQVESDLQVQDPPVAAEPPAVPAPFSTETEPTESVDVDPTE